MTRAHKIEATIEVGGRLTVHHLPFEAGQRVEVIVLAEESPESSAFAENPYPLRGKEPYRFDDPCTPVVPEEDWDALK